MQKAEIKTIENMFSIMLNLQNNYHLKTRFPKSGPTYRREVGKSLHQTPQGQPVAKPGTSL